MSFITKRERVFNEYSDPFNLPPRNEGKLKAYASCTDARAWSHFWSDKTEHLVDIIKRNNEVGRGKYVPMNVIIDMLMASKNAEISRLKRKVGQFEKMMAAYDQLELSCEQKCEISTAHAMIKAANKSLDEMALDLDLSGFTEGIDSDVYQTGKSGGDDMHYTRRSNYEASPGRYKDDDEWQQSFPQGYQHQHANLSNLSKHSMETKINQVDIIMTCKCDASTSAHDTRIEEYQEALISKDAKLSAMQNTIAVMENDVCEPYCIYAHIYTALEKIFGTLRQNEKYRLFLDTMAAGKDIRCIDIKGKILFKLKVLEKFSIALLAPCSERFKSDETCECYTAQVLHVETTFALTAAESQKPIKDKNRAQLVADIMEHEEMREILYKEDNIPTNKTDDYDMEDAGTIDTYSIDMVNLNRLKHLQLNYEDLMMCYETVKHERDNLKMKCLRYDELEEEIEHLKNKLREYNSLYNEREYYRKRSEDLDALKEHYLLLSDETNTLETQLKAEAEINEIKSSTINDLRNENIALEKKLNDARILFEKEKNALQCKLKETECTVMCQEQQIKSLSTQIDRILEQDQDKQRSNEPKSVVMIDQIDTLNDHINRLKEALYNSEEEKLQLQAQFEENLKTISELKMDIESWKSTCDKTLERNEYLESYTDGIGEEIRRLVEENRTLSLDVEEKTTALGNLINVINNKSLEINKLVDDIEMRKKQNKELQQQLQEVSEKYGTNISQLQLAKQESQELLKKVQEYEEVLQNMEEAQKSECNELKHKLSHTESNNSLLMQEVEKLREANKQAIINVNILQDENHQFKHSFELKQKESEALLKKVNEIDKLKDELQNLKTAHKKLTEEKNKMHNELQNKVHDLDHAHHSIEVTKRESQHLLEMLEFSENLKDDMDNLTIEYRKIAKDNNILQTKLADKNRDMDNLKNTLTILKAENEELLEKAHKVNNLEQELNKLKKAYDEMAQEKATLQIDFDNKTEEINNLYNTLEGKIEDNRELSSQIKLLKQYHEEAKTNISELQDAKQITQQALTSVRRESEELVSKLKEYEELLQAYEDLKINHQKVSLEKARLQSDLEKQLLDLNKVEQENAELNKQAQNIMIINNDLEKALINARNEIIKSNQSTNPNQNIIQEINKLKEEKNSNLKQIRDLLDKLDESESTISDLSEEVLLRDNKIAILQNHINSLEDEVRKLHASLDEVVNAGEEIQDHSYKKIDQTLNQMEAHHSKAAHNMKMELAKLKNENCKLEEQLSITKIKSNESFKEKSKYMSQIIHLQNERQIIVTDIRQLEMTSVGDSNLLPLQCSVDDILRSLDRVRKYLDSKNEKTTTLEQTLLKVQTSSQILLSKTDEAKKLVEKEKQKIINEKEEAIASKLNMEMQLKDLKTQLEQQSKHDKEIIKSLEAELLNQKLIMDKINTNTQSYISKLKEELESIQNLYQNSLTKVSELQEKVQNLSDTNETHVKLIDKVNAELSKKSKEVSELKKSFDALKSKQKFEVEIQTDFSIYKQNKQVQTESFEPEISKSKDIDETIEIETLKVNKPIKNRKTSSPTRNDISQATNEVQILTANVDTSLDVLKNSYVDYKMKRLSPGRLETCSIASSVNINLSSINESGLMNDFFGSEKKNEDSTAGLSSWQNQNLVDIYNSQSLHTSSSKAIKNDNYHSTPLTALPNLGLEHGSENITFTDSMSPTKSTDRNLFMIYSDTQSGPSDDKFQDKNSWSRNAQAFSERLSMSPESMNSKPAVVNLAQIEDRRNITNSSLDRTKIQINLPRVENDGNSYETISRIESKSIDPATYVLDKYSLQKQIIINNDHNISSKPNNVDKMEYGGQESRTPKTTLNPEPSSAESEDNKSHHKLSRVDADCLLFKDQSVATRNTYEEDPQLNNFGLEYILDTVKREFNPDNVKNFKSLRKAYSEIILNQSSCTTGHSQTDSGQLRMDSNGYKTASNSCSSPTKWNAPRSTAEQGVNVNLDAPDYYEKKLQRLTKMLETTEKDYKKKMDAIKVQYDNNIKSMINEHNLGVNSIQSLHEETLQDVIKMHENEVENLRSMSIEAMRKAERLEKENRMLRNKIQNCICTSLDEEPVKMSTSEIKRRKKHRGEMKMLTKTNVEAFNVRPKPKLHGPCTCSLDVNVSDTIRTIFEQVDVEQKKFAEHAYLKDIANKILMNNVESLDAQELAFLHLKVCRTWRNKLTKEEALQKRIHTLESELMNKQRHTQQHIAELDRKVAEERRRLQEARDAVCRRSPERYTPPCNPHLATRACTALPRTESETDTPSMTIDTDAMPCNSAFIFDVNERRSAGDLLSGVSTLGLKFIRAKPKPESRAVLVKLDTETRREKKLYDEPPTRLRRAHERLPSRSIRK